MVRPRPGYPSGSMYCKVSEILDVDECRGARRESDVAARVHGGVAVVRSKVERSGSPYRRAIPTKSTPSADAHAVARECRLNRSRMARPPVELSALAEDRAAAVAAVDDLRVLPGVAPVHQQTAGLRAVSTENSSPRARVSPMLKYWLPNVTGSNGPVLIRSSKWFAKKVASARTRSWRKPLFDAGVESARSLRLEIGIAQVDWRRAVGLPEGRLLDAAAAAGLQPRGRRRRHCLD